MYESRNWYSNVKEWSKRMAASTSESPQTQGLDKQQRPRKEKLRNTPFTQSR